MLSSLLTGAIVVVLAFLFPICVFAIIYGLFKFILDMIFLLIDVDYKSQIIGISITSAVIAGGLTVLTEIVILMCYALDGA